MEPENIEETYYSTDFSTFTYNYEYIFIYCICFLFLDCGHRETQIAYISFGMASYSLYKYTKYTPVQFKYMVAKQCIKRYVQKHCENVKSTNLR